MKILIGLPTNDSRVNLLVVQSLIDQLGVILQGVVVQTCIVSQTLIYTARNAIADEAVNGGYDYLMFIDSDCVLPKNAIARLLSHNKDIVSGMYFQKGAPFLPVIYRKNEMGLFDVIADYPENALIEADGIGMGVCLIKTDVLRKVIDKNHTDVKLDKAATEWLTEQAKTRGMTRLEILKEITKAGVIDMDVPKELYNQFYVYVKSVKGPFDPYIYPNGIYVNAEDLAFCIRAKDIGYKIWVDTGVQAQHQGNNYITEWYHKETLKRAEKQALLNTTQKER
jgi:hypothetical protein